MVPEVWSRGFVCVHPYQAAPGLSGIRPRQAESGPARTVRSAPTRGDTLDKLNSDKSACQDDLKHGRYLLSMLCHISVP